VDKNVVPIVVYKHTNSDLNLLGRHTDPKPKISSCVHVCNYDEHRGL